MIITDYKIKIGVHALHKIHKFFSRLVKIDRIVFFHQKAALKVKEENEHPVELVTRRVKQGSTPDRT
jgi:hypothetical protein